MNSLFKPDDPFVSYAKDYEYDKWLRAKKKTERAANKTAKVVNKAASVSSKTNKVVSKATKKAASKVSLSSAVNYGAAFVGTNMLFPGSFWQNAASSAAFEGSRIAAKKMGHGGWKQWAAAAGGSIVTNALWMGGSKLSGKNDIAAKEALGGSRFSGYDDAYNTIEGLRHGGMAEKNRKTLTEFGSGYQGPNPWLNPTYNQAEDIERYKTMRASKLGASEEELYKYYTEKEEMPEYVQASAQAGTALHLVEEAKALKAGRVEASEELAYDSAVNVTGHIDLTYKSGSPADIKTLSGKRYKEMQRKGAFEKHTHQLNWYMNQKNAQTGYLEYINREDTSQRQTIEVAYDPKMYEEDMAKVKRVRERVKAGIREGTIDESSLPKTASLQRLQADAANSSGEMQQNTKRIPYLEGVYKQEMEYLNSVRKQKKKRIKNFREVSTNAVGIGHRSAFNAGRKHSGYRSTVPA